MVKWNEIMETYNYVANETGDDSRENEHVPILVFFFPFKNGIIDSAGECIVKPVLFPHLRLL